MALLNRLMVFLVFGHVILFFAGVQGFVPSYEGDNPHQAFINESTGDEIQDSLLNENESSVVSENVGVGYTSLNFVQKIKGILFSPYSLLENAELPAMFTTLFKSVLSVVEIVAIGGFLRGVIG